MNINLHLYIRNYVLLHSNILKFMELNVLMRNVKKIRLLKNFTMRYIADVINCDQGAYSRWESGESEPKVSQFVKIADLFEMTLDEIVAFDPETHGKSKKVNYDERMEEIKDKMKPMDDII